MIVNIEVLCHSSIKFSKEKIIYFDPFKIDQNYKDADLIFITHSNYDHISEDEILRVKKNSTKFIITSDLKEKTIDLGFDENDIIVVLPNQELEVDNIKINTIPAYNTNKQFHPKENNWVGYIIELDSIKYYIAGDTDVTDDNMNITCDVTFVPVGGTFTMTYSEAANLVNHIKPKIAIPTHYGSIVGDKEDGNKFIDLLSDDIDGRILLK